MSQEELEDRIVALEAAIIALGVGLSNHDPGFDSILTGSEARVLGGTVGMPTLRRLSPSAGAAKRFGALFKAISEDAP